MGGSCNTVAIRCDFVALLMNDVATFFRIPVFSPFRVSEMSDYLFFKASEISGCFFFRDSQISA